MNNRLGAKLAYSIDALEWGMEAEAKTLRREKN